nr:response regulator transcription factor [Pseudopedobacter sp.]
MPKEAYSDFEENNYELSQLSNREYKVLELIADGLKDQEIADQLFVTIATVKTHKQRIYRKLNINNKLQAAQIYSEFNSKVIDF